MTEHHHDHPLVNITLSMGAGLLSWFADPLVWRALAVAAACGFVGGMFRGAGWWTWNRIRERRAGDQNKGKA